LSIGFIAFTIIFLFIQKEKSYDEFHTNAENIYRLEERWSGSGEEQHSAASTSYLAPYLIDTYPEVESETRFVKAIWTVIINHGEERFLEDRFCFADSTFFNFFDFRLIEGNAATVLNSPDKVVLTATTASKYFGDENPIGKQILYEGNHVFTVSGIVEDMPENSHFHFDLIFPIQFIMRFFSERDKGDNVFYSYIRLYHNDGLGALKWKVNSDLPAIRGYQDKLSQAGIGCEIIFQPLLDIHLKGRAERELEPNGNALFIAILKIVAFFLLLVAGINYSNLATAKSLKRTREIGIRRVLGAGKPAIFLQFMGESFFLSFVSLVFSLLLLLFILPVFNSVFNVNLSLGLLTNYPLLISLFAVVILLGFLSGAYPALVLSRMNMLKLFKLKSDQSSGKKSKLSFRSSLIILQFAISVFFIIGSLVINDHIRFLKNRDVGFEKEKIMVIPLKGREVRNSSTLMTIREELMKTGRVKSATVSNVVPGERFPFHTVRFPRLAGNGALQSKEPDGSVWMRIMLGDEDMVQTLGLQIIDGRNFSEAGEEDTEHGFIINEAAVRFLGLSEPIGEPVEYTLNVEDPQRGRIIGVVKDFNFASLHSQVEPVVLYINSKGRFYLILRTETVKENILISDVENIWKRFYPDIPFESYFMDDKLESLYKAEDTMQNLASVFTFIVIFIATIGLLGISFYMMEQRKKEIGLRRVMGSSVSGVLYLVAKDFIILVLTGNLLAWMPVTILLNKWLQDFAYHNGINYMIYALTVLISVLIALATVSLNVLRTALTNPVKAI
jgi:putative ABC transport system permease protein